MKIKQMISEAKVTHDTIVAGIVNGQSLRELAAFYKMDADEMYEMFYEDALMRVMDMIIDILNRSGFIVSYYDWKSKQQMGEPDYLTQYWVDVFLSEEKLDYPKILIQTVLGMMKGGRCLGALVWMDDDTGAWTVDFCAIDEMGEAIINQREHSDKLTHILGEIIVSASSKLVRTAERMTDREILKGTVTKEFWDWAERGGQENG